MDLLRSLAFSAAIACSSFAHANVLVVAPSGAAFDQISSAVAAASDGDVILVRTGHYGGFVVDDKELAVVADTGAQVDVDEQVRIRNLAATRSVVLVGIDVHPIADAPSTALVATFNAGSLRFQGCDFVGPFTTWVPFPAQAHGVELLQCPDVAFVDCTLSAGYSDWEGVHGLIANGGRIALHQSDVLGGRAGNGGYGYGGGDGARLSGATQIFASGCTFVGANGSSSFIWCPPGGPGIRALSADALFLQRSSVSAGAYGSCPFPHAAPQAYELNGASTRVRVEGRPRELRGPAVARENGTLTLQFSGVPGDMVELVLADATRWSNRQDRHGISLVKRRITSSVISLGAVAGDGTSTWSMPVSELGPGIESALLHAQAVFRNPQGEEFLSSFAVITLLDAAF